MSGFYVVNDACEVVRVGGAVRSRGLEAVTSTTSVVEDDTPVENKAITSYNTCLQPGQCLAVGLAATDKL